LKLKSLAPYLSLIVLSWATLLFLWLGIFSPYSIILTGTRLTPLKTLVGDVVPAEPKKQLVIPPPISYEIAPSVGNKLTIDGIIAATNIERIKNGALALTENSLLNAAASAKAKDMFDNQYFAHESPTGKGPGELVEATGYEYILIGENLAEGGFKDSVDVVTAWMNSPGHKANILNTKFVEIGVAAERGIWDGRNVWMAVQEFGLPLSACDSPTKNLLNTIENNKIDISLSRQRLDIMKYDIETSYKNDWEGYNNRINDYNILVIQYNILISATQGMIKVYNIQVSVFNDCLSEISN